MEIATQVQKAKSPYKINPKRNMTRNIQIKLIKIKSKGKKVKSIKGKATNNILGNPYKANS